MKTSLSSSDFDRLPHFSLPDILCTWVSIQLACELSALSTDPFPCKSKLRVFEIRAPDTVVGIYSVVKKGGGGGKSDAFIYWKGMLPLSLKWLYSFESFSPLNSPLNSNLPNLNRKEDGSDGNEVDAMDRFKDLLATDTAFARQGSPVFLGK